MHELDLATRQLGRMRGMNRYYHSRFFSDIRNSTILILALLVIGWVAAPEAFLLIPIVALVGANQTAFDASYLIFSRQYSTALEHEINNAMRRKILVASDMEETYLFPLDRTKLVVAGLGRDFTWFGWMTLFYTVIGVASFAAGIGLGWATLTEAGTGWLLFYVTTVATLTIGSLAIGWWWFVGGEGETRLSRVIESRFGRPVEPAVPSRAHAT